MAGTTWKFTELLPRLSHVSRIVTLFNGKLLTDCFRVDMTDVLIFCWYCFVEQEIEWHFISGNSHRKRCRSSFFSSSTSFFRSWYFFFNYNFKNINNYLVKHTLFCSPPSRSHKSQECLRSLGYWILLKLMCQSCSKLTVVTSLLATSFAWYLIYKFKNKSILSYFLLHQLSASESPVKIGPLIPEICRNKQTDEQTDKNGKKKYFVMYQNSVAISKRRLF